MEAKRVDGYQLQTVGETIVLSLYEEGGREAVGSYVLPLRGAYDLGTRMCVEAARGRARLDGTDIDRGGDADDVAGLASVEADPNVTAEQRDAARRELAESRAKALRGRKGPR